MKWTICILTLPGRESFLRRLLDSLMFQVKPHLDVHVSVTIAHPSETLGESRQYLIDSASGEYVNFIDDDDLIATDYISTIYPLLDRDYVGFQVQTYMDRDKLKPAYHSLRYGDWYDDATGYYRDISHLNPMRRELAVRAKFEGGVGEDHRWADRLRALGCVRTEHFIPRTMYYYFCRSDRHAQAPEPWTSMVPLEDADAGLGSGSG